MAEAIGRIETLSGTVNVERAAGGREKAAAGTEIFQLDAVETGPGASAGLRFVDDTHVALDANAHLVIDEMVYGGDGGGSQIMSLLQGAAIFVTGEVARNSDDGLVVNTSGATLGIRGTMAPVACESDGGACAYALWTPGSDIVISYDGEIYTIDEFYNAVLLDPEAGGIVEVEDPSALAQSHFMGAYGSLLELLVYLYDRDDWDLDAQLRDRIALIANQQPEDNFDFNVQALPPLGPLDNIVPLLREFVNLFQPPLLLRPDDNEAPAASADTAGTNEDSPLSVAAAAGLLDNDTDADGDPLVVIAAGAAANGTVTVGPDGAFTYVPSANFNGIDTFAYTVSDGEGGTSSAAVTVTVTAVNDAPIVSNDQGAVAEDGPGTSVDVLANDTDVEGDPLTIVGVSSSGFGASVSFTSSAVTYDPAGQFEFLASGETRTETIQYTVSDGNSETRAALVTFTVVGENDLPQPVADDAMVSEDGPGTAIPVLANDTDIDGDPLTVVGAANGGESSASVSFTSAAVTFDPNDGFEYLASGATSVESLTYTVSDGNGGSATAAVAVTVTGVNDMPSLADDTASISEDGPAVLPNDSDTDGTAIAVLNNDTDIDGDPLTVIDASNGGPGSASFTSSAVTFDPAGAYEELASGQSATESITYTVSDGNGSQKTASVTVTVTGENDAPIPSDDVADVAADSPGTAIDVLANDSDVDGDPLTVLAAGGGSNGTSVAVSSNFVVYDPGDAFVGLGSGATATESLTYTVSDGNGSSATAAVTVTVGGDNQTPSPVNDQADVAEGGPATAIDVLANDTDIDGDPLTLVAVSGGTSGTIAALSAGFVTYDPNGQFESLASGATAVETLTYTVSDGNGATAAAQVTVTVDGQNDGPVASSDAASVSEDGPATAISVLTNDTDIDGDPLTVLSATGGASGAIVAVSANFVTYDPNGQFEALASGASAVESLTYTVSDGNGSTDTAAVAVTVLGQNDTPLALDDGATVGEDGPATSIAILTNDFDIDEDGLTVVGLSASAAGASVSFASSAVTYDPNGAFESLNSGETATDTLSYTISDGNGGQATASVTVTVTGENEPLVVLANRTVWVPDDPAAMDSDFADGYPLGIFAPEGGDEDVTITVTAVPDFGTVVLADGTAVEEDDVLDEEDLLGLRYIPDGDVVGNEDDDPIDDEVSFSYVVDDGGTTATGSVDIKTVLVREPIFDIVESPVNSGRPAELDLLLRGDLMEEVEDPTQGTVTIKTDFQQQSTGNPLDDADPFGTTLPALRNEVRVVMLVPDGTGGTVEFVVIEDGLSATDSPWAINTEEGLWEANVDFDDIVRADGSGQTLAEFLDVTGQAPQPDDTWEVTFEDSTGGQFQARKVIAILEFDDFEDFDYFVPGSDGADLIYGTNGNDVLLGGDGDDEIIARAGADLVDGGDGADLIDLGAFDGMTDVVDFDAASEFGDTIVNFETGDSETGGLVVGDLIDLRDIFAGVTLTEADRLQEAVDEGRLAFGGDASGTTILVDPTLSGTFMVVATLDGLAFSNDPTFLTELQLLGDNIVV